MGFEYKNTSKPKSNEVRKHLMSGYISPDGREAKTIFYSHSESQGIQTETGSLTTDISVQSGEPRPFEKNPLAHDPLHVLVQAKLDSLGVKEVRVTSVENEIMVNALARISKQFNNRYGGSSEANLSNFMVTSITQAYPDAQGNVEKYEGYAEQLFKLYMQTIALGRLILKHETFTDSEDKNVKNTFLRNIKDIQVLFTNTDYDAYAKQGEKIYVESFSRPDPELQHIYKDTVEKINDSLEKIMEIKERKGITP